MLCHRCMLHLRSTNLQSQKLTPGISLQNLTTASWQPLHIQKRFATAWERRMWKQEELKHTVDEIATKNTKMADRVYVWGYCSTGALGLRKFMEAPRNHRNIMMFTPYRLDFMEAHKFKAKHVACGYGFTVYLCSTKQGDLAFGTGLNHSSQLGYQESPPKSGRILDMVIQPALIDLPLKNPRSTKLVNVACGREHTWIITDNEGIFSLGSNRYGQCGRSMVQDEEYRGSQTINRISFDKKIKKICCGQAHTLILTEDGEVYSCGRGLEGQTGLGHTNPVDQLTLVRGDLDGIQIVDMSSRHNTALAVSECGHVFGWGHSEHGQLALVAEDDTTVSSPKLFKFDGVGEVKKVAAAETMCALIKGAGLVYVWGSGVLGKGPNVDKSDHPLSLPKQLFGRNQLNPQQKVVGLECGCDYFAVITESKELYMWGRNKGACLGLGDSMDQFFPFKVEVPAAVHQVACGVDHTAVIAKSFA